ncbi:23384_t:CDS:2, partial [Cetraspora pellucida]
MPIWKQIAIVLCHFANEVALLDLEQKRIKWLQGAQLTIVIQEFEYGISGLEHNLPNVISAMDGLHILIHPLIKNRSVHDACMFYWLSLYYEISYNHEQWVPGGSYIITNSAYPLKTYLIKPFPDHNALTSHERRFNKKLFSIRMIIERAFGYLKG